MLWHRRSLRLRLTVVVIALVGTLFIVGTVMFIAYERRNQELLYNALHETIVVFAGSIERELGTVERLSVDIMSDEAVQEHLVSITPETPGYEWHRLSDLLSRRFATHSRLPYVQAIVGIDRAGRATISRSDFPVLGSVLDPAQLAAFERSGESSRWTVTEPSNDRIFYFRRAREIEAFGLQELGTIVVVVEKRRLANSAVSAPFGDDMRIAVLSDGRLIYAEGPDISTIVGEYRGATRTTGYRVVRSAGVDYFLSSIYDPSRSLSYVFALPYRLVFSGIARFNTVLATVAGILLVGFVGISVWIARDVSAPIVQLAQRMRQVEEADFSDVDLGANSYERSDEIGTLYREFGVMLRRIDTLITENYRTQIAMKDSQFRSLQAQINPHFLYNTLESINWIAQMNDQDEISGMVQALGSLFRVSVDAGRQAVTIGEELELLEQYVVIQRHRYGDRLVVAVSVPEACREFAVPALTLQPLVENSLKYSLEKRIGPCRIEISGTCRDGEVALQVTDDGPGMSEAFVAAIMAGRVEPSGSGVGIKNIDERLRALFGSAGRLTVVSAPGAGTSVTVTLPRVSRDELHDRIYEDA